MQICKCYENNYTNFEYEIIDSITCPTILEAKTRILQLEIYYINKYNSFHNGLNSTKGGDSTNWGIEHNEQTKNKISDKNSGENSGCYGRNGILHPMYGKHHTEESLKKISKSSQGEKNGMYGKTHTKDVRNHLSETTTEKNTGCKWINNGFECKFVKGDILHHLLLNGYEYGRLKVKN